MDIPIKKLKHSLTLLLAAAITCALIFVISGCAAVAKIASSAAQSPITSESPGTSPTSEYEAAKTPEVNDKEEDVAGTSYDNVYYQDYEEGLSFLLPEGKIEFSSNHWVLLSGSDFSLSVVKTPLEDFKDDEISLYGYTRELVLEEKSALESGSFGPTADFSYPPSEKVKKINGSYAKDYIVFGRYEVCDVRFERLLVFYSESYQYIIIIEGDVDLIKQGMPQYFKKDNQNCGDMLIWDFEKQEQFYEALINGTASAEAMKWYNSSGTVAGSLSAAITDPDIDGQMIISNIYHTENDTEKNYSINLSYPQILGGSGSFAGINKEIYELVISDINAFKQDVEDLSAFSDVTYEDMPYYVNEMAGNYNCILSSNNKIMGLAFNTYYYTGGAHGITLTKTLNYNLESPIKINLQDIFKPGFDYVNFISAYCIDDIISQMSDLGFNPDISWISSGASPDEEKFQNFLLSEDFLIIIFNPYEVGPYIIGTVYVKIPIDAFRDNINTDIGL